ncbi:MAG: YndJ family protein [Gemmatales bacterium]|nr:YndJ family protein [Gemmatales bacterium]
MQRFVADILISPDKLTMRIISGLVIWLAVWMVRRPPIGSRLWGEQLLLLAALVLIPVSLPWLRPSTSRLAYALWRIITIGVLPAACLLVLSLHLQPGLLATLSALPWFVLLVILGLLGLVRLMNSPKWAVQEISFDIGAMFTVIGGVWLFCDRMAYRPLDFDAEIVFLTAIHFHYAAYTLPICAGLLVQCLPHIALRAAPVGILVSVPLVAAGITATHIRGWPGLETFASCLLNFFGAVIGLGQISLLSRSDLSAKLRIGLCLGGIALLVAVVLAALYGLRAYIPLANLDIPNMRTWHGTVSALGFSFLSLVTWYSALPLEQRFKS